jgi:hypothetical protein
MDNEKKVTLETIDGEKIELKVQKEKWYKRAWETTKNTTKKVVDTVIEHPLATVIILGGATKLVCGVMDSYAGVKRANNQREQLTKGETTYYDRKYDVYYNLRRPMTNSESIELSLRKERGEFVGNILEDMNLI